MELFRRASLKMNKTGFKKAFNVFEKRATVINAR